MSEVATLVAIKAVLGGAFPPDMIGRGALPAYLRLPEVKNAHQKRTKFNKRWDVATERHTYHLSLATKID